MIVCPSCNHANPEDATTCASCGGALEGFTYRACPSCGALNPAQNTFCDHCLSELVPGETDESSLNTVTPFGPMTPRVPPQRQDQGTRKESQPASSQAAEHSPAERPAPGERPSQPEDTAAHAPDEAKQVGRRAQNEGPTPSRPVSLGPKQRSPRPAGQSQPRSLADYSRFMLETAANPIDGIDGLVPARPIVQAKHEPTFTYYREPGAEQQREGALFERVATTAAPLRAVGQVMLPRRGHTPSGLMRFVLYLLVLLAASVPSFSGGIASSYIQPRPAVVHVSHSVDDLPPDALVLVAYDYSLTYAGEINALALALARQLAARSIRTAVIGTTPASLGMADQIYRTMSEETPDYRYGEDYILLGYLPGQDAGLFGLGAGLTRAFRTDYRDGRPLEEWELLEGIETPDQFAEIVVLADDERSVRRWIEQVTSRFQVPLTALVSAQVEPLLVPYQQSGQISNLVAGATGITEYEVSAGLEPSTSQRVDGYAALFGIVVFVAIITNVAYITRGDRDEGTGA